MWRNDPLVQALGTHIAHPPSQPKSLFLPVSRASGGKAARASTARATSMDHEVEIEEYFLRRRSMEPPVTRKGQAPVSGLAPRSEAERRPHIRNGGLTDRPSSWDYSSIQHAASSPEQAERRPPRREQGAAGGQDWRTLLRIERAREREALTTPAAPEQHDQQLSSPRPSSSPPAHRTDQRMYSFPSPPDALERRNSRGARSLPLGAGKVRHLLPADVPPWAGKQAPFPVSRRSILMARSAARIAICALISLKFSSRFAEVNSSTNS